MEETTQEAPEQTTWEIYFNTLGYANWMLRTGQITQAQYNECLASIEEQRDNEIAAELLEDVDAF